MSVERPNVIYILGDDHRVAQQGGMGHPILQAPMAGSGGVLVPGQREYQALARSKEQGIIVDEDIWR